MPASLIGCILEALRAVAELHPGAEVSLEANPGTTGAAALAELRAAGVNRVSFGAQSFDAGELRFLDRIHSPEAIGAAVDLTRGAGIPSIGLDLIYGLPGQSSEGWRRSLQSALELKVEHISCYALTVEEGTPLARRVALGEVEMPSADHVADLYDLATEELAAAGFEQYELSNWAFPGHHSRHNSAYWLDADYAAFGAGGHGYLSGERYENIAHPRAYSAAVLAGATPLPAVAHRYTPGVATAMSDWFATRTRLLAGFESAEFDRRFGVSLMSVAGPVLEDSRAAGVLELAPRVRLTEKGRLLHGEVAARFLAHVTP
jgi:oxygen-independent coproporphyrinogen-3 oxidase